MRRGLALLFFCIGCGADYSVPPLPDARIALDLAVSHQTASPDMSCFNNACGGCSSWARWDGTPAKVGDPCLWNGKLRCNGAELTCSDDSCVPCSGTATGTVCGADGHTIIELYYSNGKCTAYDFGSAINVCNHSPADHCVHRCDANHNCIARCASDDGGVAGCMRGPNDTCDSITNC